MPIWGRFDFTMILQGSVNPGWFLLNRTYWRLLLHSTLKCREKLEQKQPKRIITWTYLITYSLTSSRQGKKRNLYWGLKPISRTCSQQICSICSWIQQQTVRAHFFNAIFSGEDDLQKLPVIGSPKMMRSLGKVIMFPSCSPFPLFLSG